MGVPDREAMAQAGNGHWRAQSKGERMLSS